MGDFNAIRRVNERNDVEYFDDDDDAEFNSCIEDIAVEDLNAKGFFFTWSSRRGGMGVLERVRLIELW